MSQFVFEPQVAGRRGLSPGLWNNFPVDELLDRPMAGMNGGIGFFDDFARSPSAVASQALIINGYKSLTSATTTINAVHAVGAHGVASLAPTTTVDLAACLQAYGGKGSPFSLTPGDAKDVVFEARWNVSSITLTSVSVFLGLAAVDATAAVDTLFTNGTHVMKVFTHFGFSLCEGSQARIAGTNGYQSAGRLNVTHARTGAANIVWNQTDLAQLVAGTYVKTGFRFNPVTRTVSLWVNGSEVLAATISAAVTGAALWPNAGLSPLLIAKCGANFTGVLNVDWIACGQVPSTL